MAGYHLLAEGGVATAVEPKAAPNEVLQPTGPALAACGVVRRSGGVMRFASPLHVRLLLTLAVGLASCKPKAARVGPPTERGDESTAWELVWADEFEVDGRPSPANWTYEIGLVRNEELQWYQPDNATCANGLLVLTARRERVANPHHQPAAPAWAKRRPRADYTSASLTTKGLHQWLYGR